MILNFLVHRRTNPSAQDIGLARQHGFRREKRLNRHVAHLRPFEQAVINGNVASGRARRGGRRGSLPVHLPSDKTRMRPPPSGGIKLSAVSMPPFRSECPGPTCAGEAAEFAVLRRLFHHRLATERNHAQLVVRAHRFMQQVDDFLLRRIGLGAAWIRCDRPRQSPCRSGRAIEWQIAPARKRSEEASDARSARSQRLGNGHTHHATASGTSSSSQTGWKKTAITLLLSRRPETTDAPSIIPARPARKSTPSAIARSDVSTPASQLPHWPLTQACKSDSSAASGLTAKEFVDAPSPPSTRPAAAFPATS